MAQLLKVNGLVLFIALVSYTSGMAQEQIEKTPYYVSINNRPSHEVLDILNNVLSVEYRDDFGQWQNVALKIYNFKREVIASIVLAKTFGSNYYNLKLDDFFTGWKKEDIYNCELKDEAGNTHKLAIRIVEPPKTIPPDVALLVNPLQLLCDGTSVSNVEFVADINGGKSPFHLQWVVMNDARTALLYQPLAEILPTTETTSAITVNRSPDYHVLLEVKDACDNIVRREVHLMCDQEEKKISSVFVEPIAVYPPTGN
jgi:hypothetical protein